jgi:hypothetical protein
MQPEPVVLCPSCGYSRAPAGPGEERQCPICGHTWTPSPPSRWALRRAWQRRPVRVVSFAIFWLIMAWNVGRGAGDLAGRGWGIAVAIGIAVVGVVVILTEERHHARGSSR